MLRAEELFIDFEFLFCSQEISKFSGLNFMSWIRSENSQKMTKLLTFNLGVHQLGCML